MFFFLFCFEKMSSSLAMLLVMLLVHVGKLVVLKILHNSQENTCVGAFFNKVAELKACIFIKEETPTQALSCKYCETFKNSFFIEHYISCSLYFSKLLCDDRY